jgi:hypothetical protein
MLELTTIHERLASTLEAFGISQQDGSYATPPLVLERESATRLIEASARIINAARRLSQLGLLNEYSTPNFFGDLVRIKPRATLPVMARPDCILCDDNPRIIELNVDSGLGGLYLSSCLNSLYQQSRDYQHVEFGSPVNGVAKVLMGQSQDSKNYVVYSSRRQSLEAEFHYHLLASELSALCGKQYIAAHYGDVEEQASAQDSKPSILKASWVEGDDSEAVAYVRFLERCERRRYRIYSDSSDLQLDDKGTLADLYHLAENRDESLTQDEVTDILQYVVPTFYLNRFISRSGSAAAVEGKNELVIKPLGHSGGRGVVVGKFVSEQTWKSALDDAARNGGSWVLQKFVTTGRPSYASRDGAYDDLPSLFGVISPYVFGDGFSGLLGRCFVGKKHKGVLGLKSGTATGLVAVGVQ